MSSQVTSDSNAPRSVDRPVPPAFTPRPKRDPVGMSALFVAVTVVCALGASSILISTRNGGAGIAGAIDTIVTAVSRIGAPAEASDHTGSIGAVRTTAVPTPAPALDLAAVLHDSSQSASEELARVGDEIATLKSVVAEVRKDVSSVKSLVATTQTTAVDAAEAAADAVVRTAVEAATHAADAATHAAEAATHAAEAAAHAAVAPIKSEVEKVSAGLAATNSELVIAQSGLQHLYSSVDQMTSAHLRDIEAINRRIGKVEDVISLRADMTASIPTRSIAPLPRKRSLRRAGWTAEEKAPGLYVIKGPTASYEVRDGDVVPGIGKIEVVRTADGKVRLLTGRDVERR